MARDREAWKDQERTAREWKEKQKKMKGEAMERSFKDDGEQERIFITALSGGGGKKHE